MAATLGLALSQPADNLGPLLLLATGYAGCSLYPRSDPQYKASVMTRIVVTGKAVRLGGTTCECSSARSTAGIADEHSRYRRLPQRLVGNMCSSRAPLRL